MPKIDEASEELTAAFSGAADFAKGDMMEAREALAVMSGAAAESCTKLVPLLRVEIIRDFSQIVSVVFANAYFKEMIGLMQDAKKWLGGITGAIAIDFGSLFDGVDYIQAGVITACVLACLVIGLFLWTAVYSGIGAMKENQVRRGHETVAFLDRAEQSGWTVTIVNATILIALSVYLPLTQIAFQIFFCDKSAFVVKYLVADNECDTTVWPEFGVLLAIGAAIVIVFSLGLPFFLLTQINKFKPQSNQLDKTVDEIVYDADGMSVPFDDEVYNEKVETDPAQIANPFRSLYQGYEKRWCNWKIYTTIYKLFLVIAVTALSSSKASKGVVAGVTLLFMLIFLYGSAKAAPYIDNLNDFMDTAGRVTVVISSLVACVMLMVGEQDKTAANVLGAIVIIAGIVNAICMTLVLFSGFHAFKLWVKNSTGYLTFFDSTCNRRDLSAEEAIKTWKINREVKHRVWQSFWDGVITKYCGDATAQRLTRMKKDAVDYGFDYIESHWKLLEDPEHDTAKLRKRLRDEFEGVDCYWPDHEGVSDNHLDSKTGWGKMYVVNYPFHFVVVFDDALDEAILTTDEQIQKFIDYNTTKEAIKMKRVRRILRCVASKGENYTIKYPVERDEMRSIMDGTETHTNSKGEKVTSIVWSNVVFHLKFEVARLRLTVNTNANYAAGFSANLVYEDGYDTQKLPRTGKMHELKNEKGEFHNSNVVGIKNMEIIDDGGDTLESSISIDEQGLESFCKALEANGFDVEAELKLLDEQDRKYRIQLEESFQGRRSELSNKFWYSVYNNHKISRPELEKFLTEFETNPVLKNLPEEHADSLDYLYARLQSIDKSDASRTWYVFWDDLWSQNKDMWKVNDNKDLLDVSKPSAIAYKSCDRKTCEFWVNNLGMMGSGSKRLIRENMLDLLYDRMENPSKYPLPRNTQIDITPSEVSSIEKVESQDRYSRANANERNPMNETGTMEVSAPEI